MTREEAIKKLERLKNEFLEEYIDYDDTASAYNLAIEALSQPVIGNCENCKWCKELVGDKYVCNYQNSLVLGSYVEPDFYCKYWAESEERNDNNIQ